MAQERDLVQAAMAESGLTLMTGDQTPPEVVPPIPATTPVAEVTPATTPVAEVTPAGEPAKEVPAFDENKYLNEKFGGKFKSVDEINQKLTEYETLNTKFSDAEKKSKELETRLAESPFANDYIKGLNDFVKKGGDPKVYEKVAGIDPEKLNEKDALVLKYRFQHNMSKEDAEFKVARKYKLGTEFDPVDGEQIDPDVKEARIDLKLDGGEAKKFLSQYKTEQLLPPATQQQEAESVKLQSRMDSWKPYTQPLIESLSKIEVPFDEKGGTISFEVPKETLTLLNEVMQGVLQGNEIPADENGKQQMKEILLRELFYQHNKDIGKLIAGEVNKKWAKDIHHPSALIEATAPGDNATVDRDTELASFIAKSNGLKF